MRNANVMPLAMPMKYHDRVLPIYYALYTIDRLLITDLGVKFLWMKTKCDASLDFFLFFYWCKYFLQGCHDANVHLWVCHDANAPCRYVVMRMSPWVYAMTNALTQMQFIQKFPLFSNQGFINAWNQKYFQILICYFSKSHLFFLLKAPKKIGDHC